MQNTLMALLAATLILGIAFVISLSIATARCLTARAAITFWFWRLRIMVEPGNAPGSTTIEIIFF